MDWMKQFPPVIGALLTDPYISDFKLMSKALFCESSSMLSSSTSCITDSLKLYIGEPG